MDTDRDSVIVVLGGPDGTFHPKPRSVAGDDTILAVADLNDGGRLDVVPGHEGSISRTSSTTPSSEAC